MVSGTKPTGAARCRQQHNRVSCLLPTHLPLPPLHSQHCYDAFKELDANHNMELDIDDVQDLPNEDEVGGKVKGPVRRKHMDEWDSTEPLP